MACWDSSTIGWLAMREVGDEAGIDERWSKWEYK